MTDDLDKSYKQACEKLEEMTKLIKKVEKEFHQSVSSQKSNHSFQKEILKWWKKPSIISTRVISFRLFYQIPCVQKPQAACLTPTECLEPRIHPHICFYFSSDIEIAEHHRETLAKLEHGKLSTFPCRNKVMENSQEDKAQSRSSQDEKSCREHNMLVDLGRNDIGKLAGLEA